MSDLKKIRGVAVTVAVALMTVVLAACGNSSNTSADTSNAVDKAFVRQMIPHHEMAVQMATTADGEAQHSELKSGLAPDIVRAQNAEITEMKTIAASIDVTPASVPGDSMSGHTAGGGMAADARTLGIDMDAMGMSMRMGDLMGARPFDRVFIDMMIPHHQGAIRMARAELASGKNPKLKAIAKGIVAAQTKEIKQMNSWRMQWYGKTSPAGSVPA